MDLKETEKLVKDKARRIHQINFVEYTYNRDSKCPKDFKHGVQVGEGPKANHFYGASKKEAWEEALIFVNKRKK